MKQLLLLFSLLSSMLLQTTQVTFINNSQFTLFLTDHLAYGALLEPEQSHLIDNKQDIELYVYTQNNKETSFSLMYRIKTLEKISQDMTIYYHDIASKKLESLYPNQFSITHQTRLIFERQKEKRHQQINSTLQQQISQPSQQNIKSDNAHYGIKQQNKYSGSHESVLSAIIEQYNKMQQQKFGEDKISTETLQAIHKKHTPYRPSSKSKSDRDKG